MNISTADSSVVRTEDQQVLDNLANDARAIFPEAKAKAKALGKICFDAQQKCKADDNRFDLWTRSVGFSTSQNAYYYIDIYLDSLIEDYSFPPNVEKFATMAGININDHIHRTALFEAIKDNNCLNNPDVADKQSISIAGAANDAIQEAERAANRKKKQKKELTALEQAWRFVEEALISAHKVIVGKKKLSETERKVRERQYIEFVYPFVYGLHRLGKVYEIDGEMVFMPLPLNEALNVVLHDPKAAPNRDLVLRMGRGEITFKQLNDQLVEQVAASQVKNIQNS
jgi:hypothetical protein